MSACSFVSFLALAIAGCADDELVPMGSPGASQGGGAGVGASGGAASGGKGQGGGGTTSAGGAAGTSAGHAGTSGASGSGAKGGSGPAGSGGASGSGLGGAGAGGKATGGAGAGGKATGGAGAGGLGAGGASGAGAGGAGASGNSGAAGANAGQSGSSGTGAMAGAAGANLGGAAGTNDVGGAAGTSGAGGLGGTGGTGSVAHGPAPVLLGSASSYVILAEAAISSVPTSAIMGNLGLSPAAATYVTGFPLTNAGTYWTTPEVTGSVFAADNDAPTPSNLTTAIADMMTAYTDAAGRPTPDFVDLGAGALGGLTLTPGLYTWASSITVPADVTLDGGPDDTWIFQVSGDFVTSANRKVTLTGGAQAKNVVWQIAGMVDAGAGAHLEGIVLSKTAITLETGASIHGRLYAQTMVALDASTVTEP